MSGRVTATHLKRRAYVYVRQSTTRQVFEHGESTKRQYGLVDRAQSLGWSPAAVEVVDEDLGKSGASTDDRHGFVRLAEAVAHGQAGAVLALEVSRLARSSTDWQRLLSLCAVAGVVVIDEQSVYDPSLPDDKLLLDLKGTMSEAELQWLGLRLQGARHSKAERGELKLPVPTGYVWGEHGMELDPDEAVQQAVRLVFERFAVEPSAWAVVKWARRVGFQMPTRQYFAGGYSEVSWRGLGIARISSVLHNPVYAGAYAHGRCCERRVIVDGEIRRVRTTDSDPTQWQVLRRDAHESYITWETFLRNREKLQANNPRRGEGGPGAPRQGDALLAGLLLCGRCGRRMHPAYSGPDGRYVSYQCAGDRSQGANQCWSVNATPIDEAVEALFLQTMVPSELELCLAVEREADEQAQALAEQWRLRIEKAEYDARLAERRYLAVDPDNRVVARSLEGHWESRLRELEEVRQQYEQARRERRVELSEQDRARIRELARDLPRVWRSDTTQMAERKAMLRLVIEAISIHPLDVPRRETLIKVQWQSGVVTELRAVRPGRHDCNTASAESIFQLRQMAAAGLRDEEIAAQLNEAGLQSGTGSSWTVPAVQWARRCYGIERLAPDAPRRLPLPDRHPDGRYSVAGAARRFGVTRESVRGWIKRGLVSAEREDYQQHRQVWWLAIDKETAARLAPEAQAAKLQLHGLRNVHRDPLPDRHPDGRYSVRGAAALLDVSKQVIRRWISKGLLPASQDRYQQYRRVWWLDADVLGDPRLREMARLARENAGIERENRKTPLPDRFPDGRYSLPGLGRHYDVTENVVRAWIKSGLVQGSREDYKEHRRVWRLELDETTAAILEAKATQSRERAKSTSKQPQ
ncbi:MAG: recombinase family protein [Polyangia bacterium]|jgi:DNA invertase Pin-like site-specific DNA recombinase|nr:recombinase family protein [Polyangia bacterium]